MPEDKRNSRLNAGIFADVPAFVRGLTFADLPADVVEEARRCLLDLIGVAAAGSRSRAAQTYLILIRLWVRLQVPATNKSRACLRASRLFFRPVP
jgi:2-methylcitrate dehydratase PrpD